MGYYYDENGNLVKEKKKKKQTSENKNKQSSSYYAYDDKGNLTKMSQSKNVDSDIAPVRSTATETEKETKKADERTWFQKGAFDDGYQFGDVTKTVVGTLTDVNENINTAVLDATENLIDTTAYGIGAVGGLFNKDFKDDVGKFIAKEILQPEKTGETLTALTSPLGLANAVLNKGETEENSVLGDKADGLVQSGSHLIGSAALQAVGVPTWLTMGVNAFGGEIESAFQNDATYLEAGISGGISAVSEIVFEKISGGVKFKSLGGTWDEGLQQFLKNNISNKVGRTIAKYVTDMVGEGTEEVLTEAVSAVGRKLTYASEKEWDEILSSEDLFDAFIGGAAISGIAGGGQIINSARNGTDYTTGLTANEEKVVKKLYDDKIAETQKGGKKLKSGEKAKIYDGIVEELKKGYISTDTIEGVLGGKTFEEYKNLTEQEKSLTDEISQLENLPKEQITVKQSERLTAAREELKNLTNKDELKSRLTDGVKGLIDTESQKLKSRGSYLAESYNEVARKGQAFEADLTQYKGKQKAAYERAIKSGVLNNTNRSHELVATLSKIEADKGIVFDYANNAKLKETGFALDGKTVNAFVKNNAVTLNVQSQKAWQSTVGHEITHILEGTAAYGELQKALFSYAESKGELETRRNALTELYNGIDADIDAELTADLVGDYLFSDKDFVKNLTGNRTVFEKIYDEIKYLCKVATGKELTEIEKVKREFDKAWKDMSVNANTETDGKTNYSLSGINKDGIEVYETSKEIMDLTWDERKAKYLDVMKNEYRGRTAKFVRNGHTYYAEFDQRSINKHIYGDKRSSKDGLKALTKAGADGDVFDLVENSQYDGSLKNKKNHTNADYFDYFIKTVQIDGKVFDLIADVEKNYGADGGYVYTLALKDNKKIKASPADGPSQSEPFQNAGNTLVEDIVTENSNDVKTQFSVSADSNGNELSLAVQKRFANSKAVDENGNLKVLYHGTASGEFYTFDKSKGSVEGDFGSGFYFTDNEYDVENNYEGGGADFENKVARRAEQIEQEEDIDYSEAEEKARKELYVGSNKFEVYLNIENPAIVGKTNLFEYDSYAENYDREDYDSDDDYEGDIEQLITDDIDQILWDIERNVDLYSTDGIAEVLWSAVNEGGIDIEQLKANINNLYLEDNNGNLAGNEVTRQIIESLGYDGIIDNTVSTKFNMGLEEGTTHYIVFKPNQIKSIENQNPTDDPDIRKSLSKQGEQFAPVGNYSTPLNETALAPTKEDISTMENKESSSVDWRGLVNNLKTPIVDAEGEWTEDYMQYYESVKTAVANASVDEVVRDIENGLTSEELKQKSANALKEYESIKGYSDTESLLRTTLYNQYSLYDTASKRPDFVIGEWKRTVEDAPMPSDADAPFPNEIYPMTEEEANALQDEKAKADADAEGPPKTRKQLHNNIINDMKATFSSGGYDFDDVLSKAKDLSTFSTVDNTPQRVMEKALGFKEGQTLADLTVNKVAQNETEGIKWLNSFTDRKNGLLAQLSKQYNIKSGSKESAAAQMYAEGFYVNKNNDIVAYGDAELAQDFPDANVRNNIKGLASDPRIRQIYDETLTAINESRTRNAYPEIQRLDNYFLHFRAMDDTFSQLGLPFNPNDIRAKDLPTDLNGVTADLKPGQPYFASANHRTGKRTSFDLLGGLERYLTSAKNQIYHIDDIQTFRALRNYIADTYGQANGLEGIDALTEEEAQERIEQVYNSHLSTFAKFLNEEANVLAGKTALIDRGLEGIIGRRGMTFMDSVRKQVGTNMVGLNVSSSLTNFLAGVQAIAKTNKFSCVKSLAQTTASRIGAIFGKTDSFVENNPTIIRRKGAERFYRTPFQKVGDAGYVLMSAVDDVTTEFIVRAKYNEFIKNGMSEEQAITEADKWTSRLMGDRSLGQMPQIYNSKTLGLITQFQLEVRNQLDSLFYDTIQETKASNEDIQNGLARNAKTAAKVTKTFFELAVLQHLFGVGFEAVAGYNPAFDIISVLATALGFDDDEESEDTALDNIEQGFLELLEDLPYTSLITNGGRIPISSALPIKELVTGKDEYGNEKSRVDTLKETAPYYFLPAGYGQIKKTAQGLSMFNTDEDHPIAGSYTDSGALRFPVEDTLGNRIKAGVFGQWANENAREYLDKGYAPLKEEKIQEFIDTEMPIADYWKYLDGLKELQPLEGKKTVSLNQKGDYIGGLDLPVSVKNILINNIADRDTPIDFTGYENYSNFEEFDFASRYPEKYAVLKQQGISVSDYKKNYEETAFMYTDDFSWAANNPKQYTVSKAVTDDVMQYKQYTTELYNIKADKDGNGKSISGSRKEKVVDYVNNLDLDYGAKLILFKSEYPSDDTYNADIINYINNRNDLTYEERVTIYEELGFTVKDGTVYWD